MLYANHHCPAEPTKVRQDDSIGLALTFVALLRSQLQSGRILVTGMRSGWIVLWNYINGQPLRDFAPLTTGEVNNVVHVASKVQDFRYVFTAWSQRAARACTVEQRRARAGEGRQGDGKIFALSSGLMMVQTGVGLRVALHYPALVVQKIQADCVTWTLEMCPCET